MKKSRLLGAVCAYLLLLCFQSAHAIGVDGQIHLSLNPTFNPATDTTGTVTTGAPFSVYVIGDNFTDLNGIGAVEFSLSSPSLGSTLLLSSLVPASSGINFSTSPEALIGYPSAIPNTGQVLLATYTLFPTVPLVDELLTIVPTSFSSFSPPAPGWAQGVDPNIIYPFAFSSDLLLNPSGSIPPPPGSPVPIPAAVWLFGSGLLGLVGIARRKKA